MKYHDFESLPEGEDVPARYRAAHALLFTQSARLAQRDLLFANLRLAIFVGGVAYAWAVWRGAPWWGLLLLSGVFVLVAVVHAGVLRRLERLRHLMAALDEGIARVEERWGGQGRDGEDFVPLHHPYAEDLDLFGPRSLFTQLNTCRSALGEEHLAGRLLCGTTQGEAERRTGAVQELAECHRLRLGLAALGRPNRIDVRGETLRAWAEAPPVFVGWGWRAWCVANSIVLAVVVGASFALANIAPVILLFALNLLVLGLLRHRFAVQQSWAEASERQWGLLSEMLRHLEVAQVVDPRLLTLRQTLHDPEPASKAFLKLDRLVLMLQMPLNQFFLPIAVLTLWPLVFGLALERWRARYGPRFADWLGALGEFEALCALGTYAFEHPGHTWAIFTNEPCFRAVALAHPLLPAGQRVANDVRLEATQRLLVVSGSNMSGKSTLLRSIGINTVLALAGAPVCAARLELAPVAVGATMRVHDSIQEGASRFYAEVLRLRQLLELAAGERPLLFLCDEILHGTNSHDRLEGARAVIRAFQAQGALGALSTHDLALTTMAAELDAAVNVHLQDEVVDAKLHFDYRLRAGVVGKSNALALMRGAGLPV